MPVVEIRLNFLHIVQQFLSKWHLALSFITKKLFKIFSKIILWQRYASWLRAYRPCIHSQWSVS